MNTEEDISYILPRRHLAIGESNLPFIRREASGRREINLYPGDAVELLPCLEALVDNGYEITSFERDLLEVLRGFPNDILLYLRLHVMPDGLLYLSASPVAPDMSCIARSLTQGYFSPAKGWLLYLAMFSDFLHAAEINHSRTRNTWLNVCCNWGFAWMSNGVFQATGGLPSLSAVYLGACSDADIDLAYGWYVSAGYFAGAELCRDRWWPNSEKSRGLYGDDFEDPHVICVDMRHSSGREAAWNFLRDRPRQQQQ